MAPCTQLDEFYHICGHQAGTLNHIAMCPLGEGAVDGHLNLFMSFHCPEGRDIRGAYKMGQCPNCDSGITRGLPYLPSELTRLRSDFRYRIDEQDAADERLRVIKDMAGQKERDRAREKAKQRADWLADQEEKRLAEERAGIDLEHQTLVLFPDTATSLLLEAVQPDGKECAICLEDMVAGQGIDIRQLPCKHRFDMDCIVRWLEGGSRGCPCCRGCKVVLVPNFDEPVMDPDEIWAQVFGQAQLMEGLIESWFEENDTPGYEG